jgi:membrane-associated PAP2 superfamily phosphatase
MNILEKLFVFGWYPGLWLIWIGVMLAGFSEESLEHNIMTAREIVSNNLGCFLAGSASRFIIILMLYSTGALLFLTTPMGAPVTLLIGLMIGVVFNPGQILESDGFEIVEN